MEELGLSCMLNTQVGVVLAVIRRAPEANSQFVPGIHDPAISSLLNSLKSLRVLIFNPHQEWRMIDPSLYLSPFLDVVQSNAVPIAATALALSAILNILKLNIFDEKTPGAKDAINGVVSGITNCRIQNTDPFTEESILMRILQLLVGLMSARASVMLTDRSVCTVLNTSFHVLQRAARMGDLLLRTARHTMHELIQIIFSQLPHIDVIDADKAESDPEDSDSDDSRFGIRCVVDIFNVLCSLLDVVNVVETDGSPSHKSDEDVQVFALVLINSAIEMSGEGIGKHPKLLRMIQDDLFHHLIHYATCSGPLVVSMICSTVLSIYHFLRRSMRLQLEAFFTDVLFKIAAARTAIPRQEVVVEGIVTFCRQPTFAVEAYVNYDGDPFCHDVFEGTMKVLCKHAFPTGVPLTSLQVQAFEGLLTVIHAIADNFEEEENSTHLGRYLVEIRDYRPFWEDKTMDDLGLEAWVDFIRLRKAQKRKMMIAADHFNRDFKKGLEYLKFSHLISDPPDPKCYALFFRYAPRLDKTAIGEYLGDPDEFHLQVLKEFTETFDFSEMILDTALRTYLKAFRLPGESQKIQRFLEAFSEKFYGQESSQIFDNKDAVFVLCYSLIMLNTDQHSPQVKKKMTEEEFIRNNRAINGGKDLPREFLSELFQSISSNKITLFSSSETSMEMNPAQWIELMNRSRVVQPYILCDHNPRLGRDMFAAIAGPSVAVLCAVFEHADDDEILQECIEGLFSIARISQYGLVDTMDEILASFCKFTTLLNPYITAEETLYVFSNDVKPRMAILAVFNIANNYMNSIRAGWKNIVDCLLKLKRLKLLPQSVVEGDAAMAEPGDDTVEPGTASPHHDPFSRLLSTESIMEDSLTLGGSEFEQNLKTIQQCRIGNIFANTGTLPEETLLDLGRSLIFAAAGKGQKFSTSVEEDEAVGFCWDLLTTIALANTHRFLTFWPAYHGYLDAVTQFPLFSPVPFGEKAIAGLFKVCLWLLSSKNTDNRFSEELIFNSINLMCTMDKEIVDTCCGFVAEAVCKILTEYPGNLQGQLGWKSVLQLLYISGRHPETYEQAVDTLIAFMADATRVSRTNYIYCIDCAFGFAALKNSPIDKNLKILDLMSDSVNLLIHWSRNGCSDPGSHSSGNSSCSSVDDSRSSNFTMNLFLKLGEALRKTSLARREEIRNRAILSLRKSFALAGELSFTSTNCINCFNLVLFAMVNDLHEKMVEYSRRDNAEREVRSMEGTLKIAMEIMTDVCLQFLQPIAESPGFRDFWLGILRRMATCMKADLGAYGASKLPDGVPGWLTKMIMAMKEKGILGPKDDDDLWEITCVHTQWMAPSLMEDLFPEAKN